MPNSTTAFINLTKGDVWQAFTSVYEGVLGPWFWVCIILITDIAVGLKSRNGALVMLVNVLMSAVFQSFIPSVLGKVMLVGTALGVGTIFFALFRRG